MATTPKKKKGSTWIVTLLVAIPVIVAIVIFVLGLRDRGREARMDELLGTRQQVAVQSGTYRQTYVPSPSQPVPQQQAPAAAPATILATRPALQCESPVTAPSVQSGLESEPVYIRPRFTILHDSTGPFRISSCHDLIEGWKQQAICPNGADYERYQAVGNDPVQVCPKYVPMAQAPGLPIPGQ